MSKGEHGNDIKSILLRDLPLKFYSNVIGAHLPSSSNSHGHSWDYSENGKNAVSIVKIAKLQALYRGSCITALNKLLVHGIQDNYLEELQGHYKIYIGHTKVVHAFLYTKLINYYK